MRHHLTPTRLIEIKKTIPIPTIGEDTDQLELSYIFGGCVNEKNTSDNYQAVSYKIKYISNPQYLQFYS